MLSASKSGQASAGGYTLSKSLRFRSSASAYLTQTPASDYSRTTWTYSAWVKRGQLSTRQSIFACYDSANSRGISLEFQTNNQLDFYTWGSFVFSIGIQTNQVFTDPSAWYHIVLAVDTTQATSSNTVKLYVNGSQVTSLSSSTYPAQNSSLFFSTGTIPQLIGQRGAGSFYYDGYTAETNFVTGQQLTPSSFGSFSSTTGVWQPIKYSGTYGTNGFYLPFNELNTSSYVGAFNGSTSYLSTLANGSTSYAFGTNSFTIEGWFNFSSNTTCSLIGDVFNTGTGDWALLYNASVPGLRFFYNSQITATYITSNSFTPTVGAWYHFAVVRNGTTVTFYINGVASGSSTVSASITYVGTNLFIGAAAGITLLFPGSASNIRVVNGTAVYTSNFAPPQTLLTNISGTALLTLQNSSIVDNSSNAYTVTNNAVTTSLGYPFLGANIASDQSGNGNNWTTNNISLTAGTTYDSMTDVPTLTSATVANYCVINPLAYAGSAPTISNGNLYYAGASNSVTRSTMGFTGTKVYWEITQVSTVNSSNPINYGAIGLNGALAHNASAQSVIAYADNATGKTFYLTNSSGVSSTVTPGSFTMTPGDVLQIAYDGTTGKIWIGKNNTYYDNSGGTVGNPATGANAVFTCPDLTNPMAPGFDHAGVAYTATLNCGQQPFTYTPPSGFVALNAYNLPTPTILAGNKYMDATLYTGNASTQVITNAGGFQPDFVWTKSRTYAYSHYLYDSIRGVNQTLASNSTSANVNNPDTLTSFNSTGVTLGSQDNGNYTNGSASVAWQWQAGKGTTSSNTNGSITSTVSVNASAGFSVVTFTMPSSGVSTVGHGLGVAPSLIILKSRANTSGWVTYHVSVGNGAYLLLNGTSASTTDANAFNNTSPTSSVFTVGTSFNGLSGTYVAYCWTPIAGFSAFGSYTGNGSTDGVFVYLGFRPKFVMIKSTSTGGWVMLDTSRDTYNIVGNYLYANSSAAEATSSNVLDINSNGFKIRNTWTDINGSGTSYVYAAFAETPFKNSLAR